ncbi:unnamed protein product, partial [Mesorhabditis belari]|uniref:CUB domain-containing protein n=1 Tax=Mesorhabditis belari TaxID=2138241 RepID=A0AAF3EDC2_9BILA
MGGTAPETTWRREHVTVLPDVGSVAQLQLLTNSSKLNSKRLRCQLRVDTCPGCQLRIDYSSPFSFLGFMQIGMYSSCVSSENCLDIRIIEDRADWVLDSPYSIHQILASQNNSFTSTGPSIRIIATIIYENATDLEEYINALFPLKISVLNATEVIRGCCSIESTIGYIQSPRYPAAYPRSMEKKWILENKRSDGFIRLIFDDFQIVDSDGKELISTRRNFRRPPAIVSVGPRLEISLSARDFTQMIGFRARYEFVENREWPDQPSESNCDDVFDGYGGIVTWEGKEPLTGSFLDCVWIIGRLGRRLFDRVYLKVEEFDVPGMGVQLEIREGPTSIGERVLLLNGAQAGEQLSHRQPRHGFTSSLSQPAFYIRFRGYLIEATGLNIAYAQFYRWATALCPAPAEWHCDNSRCIKASLRCDGVDHCGDGSDEGCDLQETAIIGSSEDTTHLALFVVSACALLILLLLATGFASRIFRNRLTHHSTPSQNISTISSESGPSDLLSANATGLAPMMTVVGQRRFYVAPLNDLTVIEAPPTYDDALKHPQVNSRIAIPSTIAYTNQAFTVESPSYQPNQSPPQVRAEIVETSGNFGENRDEIESEKSSSSKESTPPIGSPRNERSSTPTLTNEVEKEEEEGEGEGQGEGEGEEEEEKEEEEEEELGSWV